jgi:hypothetical protein
MVTAMLMAPKMAVVMAMLIVTMMKMPKPKA